MKGKSNHGSSYTGRFHGKQWIPRSATFNVGKAPLGQHPTYAKTSKKHKK